MGDMISLVILFKAIGNLGSIPSIIIIMIMGTFGNNLFLAFILGSLWQCDSGRRKHANTEFY